MNLSFKRFSFRFFPWIALLLIIIFTGIIRYRLLEIPLERDEGEYAYAGQLILQGIPPYKEVYNMKLPGVYAAYALIMGIFGSSIYGIHLGLLIVNAMCIILVYLLARRLLPTIGAGAAAASFALLSSSQSVLGLSANAEHFVILFALSGSILMLRGLETQSGRQLGAAGFLLGMGVIMKQHGLAFVGCAIFHIAYDSLRQAPLQWRKLWLGVSPFIAGVLLVMSVLILIMVGCDVFSSFWFWTVEYAQAYVSRVPLEDAWQFFNASAIPIIKSSPLVWFLAGLGFPALLMTNLTWHHRIFLMLFAEFSLLAICPGFYFREHYFLLLLPAASLLAGTAIAAFVEYLTRYSSRKIALSLALLIFATCLGHSLYIQRDYLFHMSPNQVSRSTYGLNPFPESPVIADFIRSHSNPEDRIAILGSEPQIFFYAQRRSASGYIYMYPLMENHDFALQMQRQFIADIERNNPRYLLLINVTSSWLVQPDSHLEIYHWFNQQVDQGLIKLAGVIELSRDNTNYEWRLEPQWPVHSPSWIAIFEPVDQPRGN